MKRYWKIISICLATLIVIGTFYIQSSLATNEHLKIEFEKVNGNEDELKNIVLYGDYLGDLPYQFQPLQITSEETFNPTNLSFSQKISRTGIPIDLEELVEKHRSFMRSKDLSPHLFFEDENFVAYAHMNDFSFDIEVLTKKTDEITSIQLDVSEKENYGWMQVEEVQVIDSELKVITRASRIGGSVRDELRVYTFDMKEQKLLSDDTIASTPTVENGYSDLRIINDNYSIQRQKYLLVKIEAFEDEKIYRDGEPKLVANEFIVYDIETNQSKKVVASDEKLGSLGGSSAISNSTLFIPSQTANRIEVNLYDIESDKWGKKLSFDLVDTKNDEEAPYIKVMNGKFYIIHATTNGHTIFIGDLITGESLYEGKLKVKNQEEVQKNYRLYFHGIENVQ